MTTTTSETTETGTETTESGSESGTTTETQQSGKVGFTSEQQAHIDKLIEKAKTQGKISGETAVRKYLEEQAQSAEDQAKSAAQRAEQERDEARREALVARVETRAERAALAAGVKPERVDRFLKLVDLTDLDDLAPDGSIDADAVKAAVESTLTDVPEFKGGSTGDTSGGAPAGLSGEPTGGAGAGKAFTRAEIDAMSVEEYEKNAEAIKAQMKAGTLK
jgi:hypothetical protein